MPAMMKTRHVTRNISAGSPNAAIPMITVPTAPTPVHTAIGGPERHRLQGNREQAEAERDGRDHGYARPESGEAIRVFETESPRDLQQSSEQKCEPSIERIGCLHHRPRQPLLILRSGAALVILLTASSKE
jgi:hypothetical protein